MPLLYDAEEFTNKLLAGQVCCSRCERSVAGPQAREAFIQRGDPHTKKIEVTHASCENERRASLRKP